MKIKSAFIALFAIFSSPEAISLTLEEYLGQVRSKNEGYQAEAMRSTAAAQRDDEGMTIYMPTLVADASYTSDGRPTLAPLFQGTKTITQTASLGVQKLMDFGLNLKLYQAVTSVEVVGVDRTIVPTNKYIDTSPVLELKQSLLKYGLGVQAESQQVQKESQALQTKYEQRYKTKIRLADAEKAYWRLALARQNLEMAKEMVESAEELLGTMKKKASLDLADRADRLQAESSYRLRLQEVESARQELRAASRAFNIARSVDSETVSDPLSRPTVEEVLSLTVPKRAEFRDDVRAAKESQRNVQAKDQLSVEDNRPTLDLTAKGSLTGRALGTQFHNALDQSFSSKHPYLQVGMTFAMPLDFGRTSDTRDSYRDDAKAAQIGYSRSLTEQESDWKNSLETFNGLKERYKLTVDIESAQKEKNGYEHERFKKGRTTTFYVVQYEQEYLQARLQRARLETELLQLVAQMKTYGDSYESR